MLVSNTSVAGGAHSTSWAIPDNHPLLELHEIHVWKVGLYVSKVRLNQLESLLTDGERQRAERFSFERHRRRFIVGRAVMRILLARYTGSLPEALEFECNPQGKPSLKDADSLHFNFTNSRDLALLCVARQRRLGVDLEHHGRHADYAGIVSRFFAAREVEELSGIAEDRRHAAFLTGWTRKEAYIKALGKGLSMLLSSFAVTIDPDVAPALLHADGQPEEPDRWSFVPLDPGPGYVATLVVEGGGVTVRQFAWPG